MAYSKETMARPKCRHNGHKDGVTKGKVPVVIDGGTSLCAIKDRGV